jgi:hypothetical protein
VRGIWSASFSHRGLRACAFGSHDSRRRHAHHAIIDAVVVVDAAFTDPERVAVAGFLAGFQGATRDADGVDPPPVPQVLPR